MLSYLDNSEALELAPSEPRVDIDHTARQARGELSQGLFLVFTTGILFGKMGGPSENVLCFRTEMHGSQRSD